MTEKSSVRGTAGNKGLTNAEKCRLYTENYRKFGGKPGDYKDHKKQDMLRKEPGLQF